MEKKNILDLKDTKYTRLDRAVAFDITMGLARKVNSLDIESVSTVIYNAFLNGVAYARKSFTEKDVKELDAALQEALTFIDEAEKSYDKPFGEQGEA